MAYEQVNLAEQVSGTLPTANGGTGQTSLTSLTLVTPILGTPTSGNLVNCTGYPGVSVGVTSTALSGTTYTMSSSTNPILVFTGTTQNQVVTLPPTAVIGQQWLIENQGTTATVTCNGSTSGTPIVIAGGSNAVLTALSTTPTTAAGWSVQYGGVAVTTGKIMNVANSLIFNGTDGTTFTFPATSATMFGTTTGIPNTNLPNGILNANSSIQSQAVASGTAYYITSSVLALPATLLQGMVVGTIFRWRIVLVKTAAGTGTFQIVLYRGINGTTGDTADVSQSVGTQSAVADTMIVDIQTVVLTTGATGSYFWEMVINTHAAAASAGFGPAVAPGVPVVYTGTVSSVAMNTASLKFGLGFIATTGTPTITIPMVQAQAFNID